MTEVLRKIEVIKSVFLDTQLCYAKNKDIDTLRNYLESIEPEFRSIGYESASMAIALDDLETDKQLTNWLYFLKGFAASHKAQVYVGLGWAIAKLNMPFLSVVDKIDTQYYYRVADGCGYYDGNFRQRKTVVNKQLPSYLPEAALPIYYQGIGRSLWYILKADLQMINNVIQNFQENFHSDLWRGIGIAAAYVGGCDDNFLDEIFTYAGKHTLQLASGAALVAKSRMDAGTVTQNTDQCSRLWYRLAVDVNIIADNSFSERQNKIYLNWVSQVENNLANSFPPD